MSFLPRGRTYLSSRGAFSLVGLGAGLADWAWGEPRTGLADRGCPATIVAARNTPKDAKTDKKGSLMDVLLVLRCMGTSPVYPRKASIRPELLSWQPGWARSLLEFPRQEKKRREASLGAEKAASSRRTPRQRDLNTIGSLASHQKSRFWVLPCHVATLLRFRRR